MKLLLSKVGIYLVIGFILFSFTSHIPSLIGWVLLFTAFDILGFKNLDDTLTQWENTTTADISQIRRQVIDAYRILQGIFEAVTIIIIFNVSGWKYALSAGILHYFLVCDIAYYYMLGLKLGPFDWFKVNPIVALFNYGYNKPAPVWSIWVSVSIGVLLTVWLITF
jgi:hypothetical protein